MSETQEANCAFQYAKIFGEIFRSTKMVCDKSELTLTEAKALWNEFYPDLATHIKEGNTGEMALWINMVDSSSYGETLHHISTDAESDGIRIWETKRFFYPKTLEL